jgi:hypothetical protein
VDLRDERCTPIRRLKGNGAGVMRIDAPTRWVLLQPRVHLYSDGKVALDRARKVLDEITTTGLSQYMGGRPTKAAYDYPAPVVNDPDLPVSALDFKDPLDRMVVPSSDQGSPCRRAQRSWVVHVVAEALQSAFNFSLKGRFGSRQYRVRGSICRARKRQVNTWQIRGRGTSRFRTHARTATNAPRP